MSEGLFAHPGARKHAWREAEKEVPTIYQVFGCLIVTFFAHEIPVFRESTDL